MVGVDAHLEAARRAGPPVLRRAGRAQPVVAAAAVPVGPPAPGRGRRLCGGDDRLGGRGAALCGRCRIRGDQGRAGRGHRRSGQGVASRRHQGHAGRPRHGGLAEDVVRRRRMHPALVALRQRVPPLRRAHLWLLPPRGATWRSSCRTRASSPPPTPSPAPTTPSARWPESAAGWSTTAPASMPRARAGPYSVPAVMITRRSSSASSCFWAVESSRTISPS